MQKLRLALDWTPNVNHIGILIAKELGFYTQEGIEIEILNPLDDNYATTPGKKVELDKADLAIAPFETVISFNNKSKPLHVVAIFTVLQSDLSCIATLKSANIASPKSLDGKVYASYRARYEDFIVKELIKNDGGEGDLKIIYPEKLGIWNTLLSGVAHATWIFDNWEGVEAEAKGIELQKFVLGRYHIPYGYSPIILTKNEHIEASRSLFSKFVKTTKKGFLYAKDNVKESASILGKYVTRHDLEHIDLEKSLTFTVPHFGNSDTCGTMNDERVKAFLNWLVEKNLEDKLILSQKLHTNELFA